MNNSSYLKKYVRNHPDNNMAWYLLGKEYEASGQEGKAHYCYIQAGSVYEAFEASKVPADLWQEYQENLLQESKRKEKNKRRWRRAFLALMILLLATLPQVQAPGRTTSTSADLVNTAPLPVQEEEEANAATEPEEQAVSSVPGFTAQRYFNDPSSRQAGLASLLEESQKGTSSTISGQQAVLGMDTAGIWALWSRSMPVVYTIDKYPGQGKITVQSFDPEACDCDPPEPGQLQTDAPDWIERQESLAVLMSAMRHFKQSRGEWPEQLSDLTGEFPGNWLAGSNAIMEQAFVPLLAELKGLSESSGEADGDGVSPEAGNGSGQGAALLAGEPFFTEPIEVLVDPASHQLAVVSGKTILRTYKVGLGGERTPEGSFQISDKVVNPNGRDNGEFGSRGMQLSDTDYAIHGTDDPDSIGKDESLGCIRMDKEDVEELFDMIPKGTKVTIKKGILPKLEPQHEQRFELKHRQNQTNPHRTYRWLN
ncbi:L,D-transpeptidase [Paenibacillus antibioticophila]|uniref:L,D-transpeptidase n=1 Tax=Paenibacillus antibioticophila TaxID=1274374 RepID=UPI0005CA91E8|nr:L,D-transpeptidase [Paenibacillus antibioticophila]